MTPEKCENLQLEKAETSHDTSSYPPTSLLPPRKEDEQKFSSGPPPTVSPTLSLLPDDISFQTNLDTWLQHPDSEFVIRKAIESGDKAARWLLAALKFKAEIAKLNERDREMVEVTNVEGLQEFLTESEGLYHIRILADKGRNRMAQAIYSTFGYNGLGGHKFYTRDCLFSLCLGDLERNDWSEIYHSFFHSSLFEPHLLPVIRKHIPPAQPSFLSLTEKHREIYMYVEGSEEIDTAQHALELAFKDTSFVSSLSFSVPHSLFSLLSLIRLPSLVSLAISHNSLEAFTKCPNLPFSSIESIAFQECDVSSLSSLSSIPVLPTSLSLIDCNLKDLTGLQDISSSLLQFSLSQSPLPDLSHLVEMNLSNLQSLSLSRSSLSDLSIFTTLCLPSLQSLDLSHTKISDLSPLLSPTLSINRLLQLFLSYTFVEDVYPLRSLSLPHRLLLLELHGTPASLVEPPMFLRGLAVKYTWVDIP